MRQQPYIKSTLLALVISLAAIIPIAFILLLASAVAKLYISGNNYALHQRLDTPFFNMPGGPLSAYDLIFLTIVLILWASVFSVVVTLQIRRQKKKIAQSSTPT